MILISLIIFSFLEELKHPYGTTDCRSNQGWNFEVCFQTLTAEMAVSTN
jgi:hypothetical protein